MAEKKENKAIGYVVLSFIPLIGIIWAGIVGIQHELIVKDAKKAEEAFEAKLVQKINETQIAKDNNIVLGEVDLTSIVLNKYSIKLQNDDVSTNKFSYTVRLGTDPKTSYDENDNTVVDSFGFVYEFFVDADTYTTITESFENDKIGVLGYEEYVFETYCPDKPTSTPIYVIESIFDKYYAHTSYFEYNSEVYLGASPDTVIELINALPSEITLTKESLDAYKSKQYWSNHAAKIVAITEE